MSNFVKFRDAVHKQLNSISKDNWFTSSIDGNQLWDMYLAAFPEGTDPIYKERSEHDCQCCRQFIRNMAGVVTIKNGKLQSIWRLENLPYPFDVVANKLADTVESGNIADIFLVNESKYGALTTLQEKDGNIIKWNHFGYTVPSKFVKQNVAEVKGISRTNKQVFERSLKELTIDAAQTILELIDSKTLYRGDEFRKQIAEFIKQKTKFDKLPADQQEGWLWENSQNSPIVRIRNTAIGTLLIDLSEDVDINRAVKKFESVMAPANYKRPNAIFTKKMVQDAQKVLADLGLTESLSRRFAVSKDISVNNVLFVDRSIRNQMKDVFDDLLLDVAKKPKKFDRVKEMSIEDFMSGVLPNSSSIEIMVENNHEPNFMSLIAPENDAPSLFPWDNGFSWAYNGDITDSMRERVASLGGRIDGVLRFTHSWNHTGQNQSLMDLHVFMPGCNISAAKCHDNYPTGRRVGWNHRKDVISGGSQDVDYVKEPGTNVPIENISFPSFKNMPEGKYVFKIHNWNARRPNTTGFLAEIEANGEVFEYEYPAKLANKEWVTVAEAELKNQHFTITHHLTPSTRNKNIWGITTNDFTPVTMMMYSPNHWDNNQFGNKHYFFVLNGCKNEGSPRGFFNEFLKPELTSHKRVFEALGNKMRVEPSNNQLSGIGFSSTKQQSVIARVKGQTEQVIKINF